MKNLTAQTTLNTDFGDIDVTVSYHWENNGIGWGEAWGSRFYDAGVEYPEIDDITPLFGPADDDEHRENVRNFINEKFELCAERVSEKIERPGPPEDIDIDD